MSGFDAVNEAIKTGGGGYTKLKNVGDTVQGVILDVRVRDKVFEGKIVPNSEGSPRKEWLFTLDIGQGGVTKWTANEGAQTAVRVALSKSGAAKLEKGGKLRVQCTQEFKRGNPNQYQEFVAEYVPPKFAELPNEDEAPF